MVSEGTSDHEQQPAPRRGKVLETLTRAERKLFNRPAPKSAKARMKFLRTREGGSTAAAAERLGHLAPDGGGLPRREADEAAETESEWQPQVRAQAQAQAATSRGMMVEVTAYFGFTCTGISDDVRERHITTDISPTYVRQILELQEAGATEEELHPSSRRPSRSRTSRNGAHGPTGCVRISRRSARCPSGSDPAEFSTCYKPDRGLPKKRSGGGPHQNRTMNARRR
ncbi:telomere-protecting terminal protein Tpg [Streptomyces albidoflavus]|uniref:telomere-protecting terminal protein Tpg n=1 Tax=Streptomyces albidoflavus TaxID=1886 RepID=UPI003D9E4A43